MKGRALVIRVSMELRISFDRETEISQTEAFSITERMRDVQQRVGPFWADVDELDLIDARMES